MALRCITKRALLTSGPSMSGLKGLQGDHHVALNRIRDFSGAAHGRGRGLRFTIAAGRPSLTSEVALAIWFYWRPQGDSNPCYRRERAMSWASRRWGRGQ